MAPIVLVEYEVGDGDGIGWIEGQLGNPRGRIEGPAIALVASLRIRLRRLHVVKSRAGGPPGLQRRLKNANGRDGAFKYQLLREYSPEGSGACMPCASTSSVSIGAGNSLKKLGSWGIAEAAS